ncbi:DddA-like double-stranded DNA deaminase toxin [Allokutzneria oryzae]|uniref:DddA-like double-stranded DNA deaminase toxin n=1 Tax=Allokutzneria oryzae TaxID=1378989 RepID=A0ABV6A6P2_9PSEU
MTLRTIPADLPQEALRELVRRIHDEIRPRVYAVADNGSNAENYPLRDALNLLGSAAQDFADAANDLDRCIEQINHYRVEVFPNDVAPTVAMSPRDRASSPDNTEVPHPSRWDGHALVGTLDPAWAEQVRRTMLRPTEGSKQTRGTWFTADGVSIPMLSGSDSKGETAAIGQKLIDSPLFPPMPKGFNPDASRHVETKGAHRMRQENITYAVVVLIKRMCRGGFDCYTAVRALLPLGSTLVVREPDSDRPKIIEGEAQP